MVKERSIRASVSPKSTENIGLLTDGSAIFFGQRAVSPDKNLDYFALDEVLKKRFGASPLKPAYFFTAADESNEKQAKFHGVISDLGWTVRPVPPHEATVGNPLLADQNARIIRFDAMIAYALGRLASQPDESKPARIIIISDSWPLAAPVRDCTARSGIPVTMCFFGSVIDTRWHKVFRESETRNGLIEFLDLDMFAQRLFNRDRPSRRTSEEDILHDLP